MTIQLIVGLGNPGLEYAKTRHNAGFDWLDQVLDLTNVHWQADSKFHGEVAKVNLCQQTVWLLKPRTFMNLSGRAVYALSHFYRILPAQILLVHDELDLLPGVVKLKYGGGHGGHNGLKDTVNHLHTADFWRLRFGIGHPGNKAHVAQFVLKTPTVAEKIRIEEANQRALAALPHILAGRFDQAMQQLHTVN
jgi:PTH1 family peptidyl-tRNA hydrolase